MGAAAHSFLQKERFSNISDVSQYIACAVKGKLPVEVRETPEVSVAKAEYIFLALRTVQGLFIQEFKNYFACDFFQEYGEIVAKLARQKLIVVGEKQIYLTTVGMKYGNVVFRAFLPD